MLSWGGWYSFFSTVGLKSNVMADNNRNRSNYSSDDYYDDRRRRNANYDQDDYNNSNRNRDINQDWNTMSSNRQGSSNRNMNTGYSSDFDRKREDYNYNQYNQGSNSDYNYGSNYNSGSRNEDWNQGYQGSGNYGNYGNRNERNYGSGSSSGGYGNQYGSSGYGQSDYNQSNYGGQGQYNYGQGQSNYGQSNYGQSNYGNREYRGGTYYGNQDYNDQNRYRTSSDEYRRGNRNMGQGRQERDWWDRTRDEVSSWFGDDEAERRRRMDRATGPHKGKGPKGYNRSGDRIREDVCDRLSDNPTLDASDIEVKVEGTDVILSGTVESRADKRRAEDLAESVSGVSNVQNQLRVSHRQTDNGFFSDDTRASR